MLTTLFFFLLFFFFALESDEDVSDKYDHEGSGSGFTSGSCSFSFSSENSIGCVSSSKYVGRVSELFSVGRVSGILKVGRIRELSVNPPDLVAGPMIDLSFSAVWAVESPRSTSFGFSPFT